jgi:hypothetical protein
MKWFFNQNTSYDMSIKKLLKSFEYKRHESNRPQGLCLGQWLPRLRYENHPGVPPTHGDIAKCKTGSQ